MSDDIAIKVENLSKVYKLYNSPVDRLKESLHPLRRRYHHDFYALNDVSFEIKKGESVGIIGKNGSGKSTLLKILTGVLTPTTGTVTVNGKVSALLELGAGFNPELSGLENVYFNGMLMGYSKEDIDVRLDDILSFADIGEFVQQPVKTYSSGMFVRLAFAVAVNVEPDILIIDEALSVGDVFFQQKCYAKMKSILDSETTLLFVSHDLPGIQKLCNRGILLKKGNMFLDGTSVECVSAYHLPDISKKPTSISSYPAISGEIQNDEKASCIIYNSLLKDNCSQQGDKGFEIIAVAFNSGSDCQVEFGNNATINVLLKANTLIKYPVVGFAIFDRTNNLVFSTNTQLLKYNLHVLKPFEALIVSFSIDFTIQLGLYTFSIGCNEADPADPDNSHLHHRCVGMGPINVINNGEPLTFHGVTMLPCVVNTTPICNMPVSI